MNDISLQRARMNILEFTNGSLRYLDALPDVAPADGFVWVYLDRTDFSRHLPELQSAAQRLGGSPLLELHAQDLGSDVHPSHYDSTSVYDLVIFRRLATQEEVHQDAERLAAVHAYHGQVGRPLIADRGMPEAFARINSRAVGFGIFDRFLISVHPAGCYTAKTFIQRFLADAKFNVEVQGARSRLPPSPAELVLRMVNSMVDSYLDLRRDLTAYLEQVQADLIRPDSTRFNWGELMEARRQLHLLEDLCEEQQDAMQEWLDTLRELPLALPEANADTAQSQARHDQLIARARDAIEHIARVLHHARRLEQSAETAVQIHFSAQGQRTNEIMRTLTAITAIFLPLNLFTGFFGMNFEHLPLIHSTEGMWTAFGFMVVLAISLIVIFLRKRYLARTQR